MNSAFDIVISTVAQVLSLLIVVDALLSFILPPFHPIRETIGRALNPIYAPIRKVVPPMGMMDFTPIVAIILLQVLVMILTSIF